MEQIRREFSQLRSPSSDDHQAYKTHLHQETSIKKNGSTGERTVKKHEGGSLNSNDIARLMMKKLKERQGEDLLAYDISTASLGADVLVIATGRNTRHASALADELAELGRDSGLTLASLKVALPADGFSISNRSLSMSWILKIATTMLNAYGKNIAFDESSPVLIAALY